VRVRTGTYAGFLVDGKGIVVAEEPGASVAVTGTIRVKNTPAGAGVQVIGLTVDLSLAPGGLPFDAESNIGPVLVSRCILRGFAGQTAEDAARVASSTRVLFHECELRGGDAAFIFSSSQGGHGVRVTSSTVELHGCVVRGGRGGSDWDGTPEDDLYSGEVGGAALSLTSSVALAVRTTFTGGRGGNSSSDFLETRCP
jgi:hypothetical protein